jgi:hypothetical protein
MRVGGERPQRLRIEDRPQPHTSFMDQLIFHERPCRDAAVIARR